MKHLRKFNESSDLDKILDICKSHLSYLIDDGFIIKGRKSSNGFSSNVEYNSYIDIRYEYQYDEEGNIIESTNTFTWDQIKDDIIPLLIIIQKDIKCFSLWGLRNFFEDYYPPDDESYTSLLNGREDTNKLTSIEIELK